MYILSLEVIQYICHVCIILWHKVFTFGLDPFPPVPGQGRYAFALMWALVCSWDWKAQADPGVHLSI